MKLALIFLLIIISGNVAMADLPKLNCQRERYENVNVELDEWKSMGSLLDNYNGSDLVCGRNVSLVKDPNFVGQGMCVGIWDSGFDQNNQTVDTLAKVIITKTADGKITAEYEKNADRRGPHFIETVVLNCTVEN